MYQICHKNSIGLLLVLLFTMMVGCSPESRMASAIEDMAEAEENLVDVYETIDDMESLEAAEPKLRSIFTEMAEIKLEVLDAQEDFKKKHKNADFGEAINALKELEEKAKKAAEDSNIEEIEHQLAAEKKRIYRIPGAQTFIQKIRNEVARKKADGSREMERELGYKNIVEPKRSITRSPTVRSPITRTPITRTPITRRPEPSRPTETTSRPNTGNSSDPFGNRHGNNNVSRPGREELDTPEKRREKWVKDLYSDSFIEVQRAFHELNQLTPSAVPQDLRFKIARRAKAIALDSTAMSGPRKEAVQGLVIWGGIHSAPYLVQVVKESYDVDLQDAALKGLKEVGSAKGAEVAAKALSKRKLRDNSAIFEYLEWVGPPAEQPVLDYVEDDDFKTTLKTVQLLGKIGTRKSLKAFALLEKNASYRSIQAYIDEAKQAILEREKQKESKEN